MYKFLAPEIQNLKIFSLWLILFKKCLIKNYHKINVRPVGNAAQDIHNRAIKSATDWFDFFYSGLHFD